MQHEATDRFSTKINNLIEDESLLMHHGAARLLAVGQTVTCAVAGTADAVIGIGAGAASIVTAGCFPAVNKFASTYLDSAGRTLQNMHFGLLRAVNPDAEFVDTKYTDTKFKESRLYYKNGVVSTWLATLHKEGAVKLEESNSCLARQVALRLWHLIRIPFMLAARTIDALIGLLAAVGSLATFGKCEKLNNLSYSEFSFLRALGDLHYSLTRTVNPSACSVPRC